jgi:dimethylamine/trimethylamine dehydrogenase
LSRDPNYDVLFEPIKIGPVTTRNRFYQVPHCTGMGYLRPHMLAAMRGVKAEGGWGVVCTEYNSIHPTSDDLTHVSASLWDDNDIGAHRLMTDAVHDHGALAGVELWHGGARTSNQFTRLVSMDVDSIPNLAGHPFQTRAMDKADIRDLRRWHRLAALRARDAGFDIVYVYATHGYLVANFLDPRMNTRTDEYGGSLQNRVRLVRELIEETKDAIGGRCAVAVRFKADESIGEDGVPEFGERREMFALLSELPDLWDINIADYSLEMGVSRFVQEGALEPYMSWVKSVTSKPVVTVGRFTSPDAMVSQIRRGITDLIGAARPSIADPFLPKKIEEGRHRGHPRVHRMQHVLLGRQPRCAAPLHAESGNGRGVAQGVASRARAGQGVEQPRPDRRRGAGWPRSGAFAGRSRLRGQACRGQPRTRWPCRSRGAPAGHERLHSRA